MRRLTTVLAALYVVLATLSASVNGWICRAELGRTPCACDHSAGLTDDDCCTRQSDDAATVAPIVLVAPSVRALAPAPVARWVRAVRDPSPSPAVAGRHEPRAPPVPRFLALRTLLI